MARTKTSFPKDDSSLNIEVQLWAAAGQAVPAPACEALEYTGGHPPGLGRVYKYFLGKFASEGDANDEWRNANVEFGMVALDIMNLALRGILADFGPEHADTFRRPDPAVLN